MREMMRNIEKQGVGCKEKEVKIYIRHSQKDLRRNIYVEPFSKTYLGPM